MIRLITIGPASIQIGDTRVPTSNHQAFSALLYLTVERGKRVSRRTLMEMFFPDAPRKGAGHSVRQLAYRLRQLGAPLDAGQATVTLPLDAAKWDVDELMERGVASERELEALAGGYLLDFLPQHSDRFTQWLDDHRAQVSGKLRHLLVRQLGTERSRRRFQALEKVARACLALDPLNEEATLGLAESLAMAGSKADALQLLDRYVDETGPRSAALRVAPRLLRDRISHFITDPEREPVELIGRDAEVATLLSYVEQSAAGSARACIVTGPSGIGKTRLLNEVCSLAALTSHAVVRARLHRHDANRPFAVLRELGPGLLDLPGAIGASAEALASLRGLCGRGPSQYRNVPSGAFEMQAVIAEVHARFLEVVDAAAEEQPLVFIIEDAHWIDDASRQLLAEAIDGQRSLCILLASQRDLALSGGGASSPAIGTVSLGALSRDQSRLVLRKLFEHVGQRSDPDFIESASAIAAGVPFYLVLLFHNYRTTGDPKGIPHTLSASLAARLDQLTDPARGVFEAVVVLGPYSTERRIESVTQYPRFEILQALRWLEEGGFTRLIEDVISPAHDLLADAARRRIVPSVSRLLHRAVAGLLEDERHLEVEPLAIAAHWEACGEDDRALLVLTQSADEYSRLGRAREGLDLLDRARLLAHTLLAQRNVDIAILYMCHAAGEDKRGVEVARRLGLYEKDASPELQLLALELLIGAGEALVPFAQRAEAIAANKLGDADTRAKAARILVILAEDLADEDLGRRALSLIADIDDISCDVLLPKLIYETVFGSTPKAVSLATRIHALASDLPLSTQRVRIVSSAGIAMWRSGEFDVALQFLEESYNLAKEAKVWSSCTAFASILADVHWTNGDVESTRTWYNVASGHISRSPNWDKGFQFIGISVLLAIEDGRLDEAGALVDEAIRLYPRILDLRMGLDAVTYRLRIELARGLQPAAASLDKLLNGHLERRGQGLQDIIADTLILGLSRAGRHDEATRLRDEYLSVYRKDRFGIPPQLAALRNPDST